MEQNPKIQQRDETRSVFSRDELNRIFATSPKAPDRLISRENSCLEFKETFSFGSLSKYMRSAAGFANAKGGYMVYGVKDKPHTLIGLKNSHFDELDPERMTEWLNAHFDPEIRWDRHLHEIEGRTMGLLYFYPAKNRPVICKKTADDGKALKEGEIYYRYNGRTQTIRYAELKELINESRKQEQLLWLRHLKTIARVGISDAAVFDLRNGEIKGASGNLVIDESLLSQISFIREGEFSEKKGRPTLKLVGSVEPMGTALPPSSGRPQIIKTQGIRTPDIILAFLRESEVPDPVSYLTQICFESSAFLPVYYFIKLGKLSLADAVSTIEKQHSTVQAKAKLLGRLKSGDQLSGKMPSANNANGTRKIAVRKLLIDGAISGRLREKELSDVLSLIPTIGRREMPLAKLRGLLLSIFNAHFAQQNASINQGIRRAICYVDWLYYHDSIDEVVETT